jgi:hypothetical protein
MVVEVVVDMDGIAALIEVARDSFTKRSVTQQPGNARNTLRGVPRRHYSLDPSEFGGRKGSNLGGGRTCTAEKTSFERPSLPSCSLGPLSRRTPRRT